MNKGNRSSALGAVALVVLITGCAGRPSTPPPPASETVQAPQTAPAPAAVPAYGKTDIYWVPPLITSPEEQAAYYVSRLSDRRFIAPGPSGPRYVAAEELGRIGLPAVALLLSRLDSRDEYEVMLALYALELATSDPQLLARTRSDAIELVDPLNPEANARNVAAAKEWQARHPGALEL
ncbi:hypothetical protein [Halomonas sp. 707D7]|uniref:hypothetical protein n=2 Tax=unclassified Halomonas TaxID=2609666 RepID=UPI00209D99C0|nr:hypothetical protein [Halomonas sp. 707D7]MCP1313565.1 hypothetical protein [Halomonas sp. 707D7]